MHTLRRATLLAAVLTVLGTPAIAQMRTNNAGSPAVLRKWPVTGVWVTFLARLVTTHDLGCAMVTGYRNTTTGETYFWGIRRGTENTVLEIADNNPTAVAGPSIAVTIDGTPVGTYPITLHIRNGAYETVGAALTPQQAETLTNLLRLGGQVQYKTQNSTYSASLAGAARELFYMNMCFAEASKLNGLAEPAGQSFPPTQPAAPMR